MSSAQPVGTFSVQSPFQVLCHRTDPISPDKERISPYVTRRQAYKQRMPTDTNTLKIGVYVSRPLMLSGKVRHPLYCDKALPGVDEQWNLKSVMVTTRQVKERHTGANMAALLNDIVWVSSKLRRYPLHTLRNSLNLLERKYVFKEFAIALYRSFLSQLKILQTPMPRL